MKEVIAFIFFILSACFFFLDVYTSVINIILGDSMKNYYFKFFIESLLMFMIFAYSRGQQNYG